MRGERKKRHQRKNDGNEDVSMDDNEKIEADSDAGSFAEENWNDPEQNKVAPWTEPGLPITVGKKSGNRKRTGLRYNRYGDDFLIDKIRPDELGNELLGVGELVADNEWQIIDDSEHYQQPAGRLLRTRTRNRSGSERDRKDGKHEL